MWITTITYDATALRALPPEDAFSILQSVIDKKDELRANPVNGGGSLDGFKARDSLSEIDPSESVVVVKRGWNNQSVAQEFVDFVNSSHSAIVATLEEQV
jgi:hypothetical protein